MKLAASICLCLAALGAVIPSPALGFVEVPVFSYVPDQPTFTAAAGESVTVTIFLDEIVYPGQSSVLLDQHGLFSVDFTIELACAGADPADIALLEVNPEFNGVVTTFPDPIVIADRDLFETEGVAAIVIDVDTVRVPLATFTLTAGDIVGETTCFSIVNYENPQSPGLDQNTYTWDDTNASFPLDESIAPGGFSLTVIPEPATMTLLALGGLMALRRRK